MLIQFEFGHANYWTESGGQMEAWPYGQESGGVDFHGPFSGIMAHNFDELQLYKSNRVFTSHTKSRNGQCKTLRFIPHVSIFTRSIYIYMNILYAICYVLVLDKLLLHDFDIRVR